MPMNSFRQKLALLATISYLLLFASLSLQAQTPRRNISPEQQTANHFESLRNSPPQLFAFLKQMPKGGDLHNHLSGAVYAESYVQWAATSGLCVSQTTFVLSQPPCDQTTGQITVTTALSNIVLYRQLIDAWSMRNWAYSGQNGHDHFFDTFTKFGPAHTEQLGPMLAEVAARAARGHVSYLELMLTPDGDMSRKLGEQIGWDGNFEATLAKLKSGGIADAVTAGIKALQNGEAQKDRLLKCGTVQADPGCSVTIRFISQVLRGDSLARTYAQLATSFELASNPASKVVGLNLVQPEDWVTSMQNFSTQMDMLNFLHSLYPKAHITLHAGELVHGMVPPEGLSFHIRDSIIRGHAERIGHGSSVMLENDPSGLLKDMARRQIMVEICLTSNDIILGVSKSQHPLATYLQYGVPVALGTDDEGVSRSEMSREYLKAAEEQGLGYIQLKTMARASLHYSFLPGASLWLNPAKRIVTPACAGDLKLANPTSTSCKQFLASSEKATLQWKLEQDFHSFEKQN